jgi:hypothetical protein
LLRHIRAPGQLRAAGEVVAIERLLAEHGARAMIFLVDVALPPPSFAALREYRSFLESDSRLEKIAMVTPNDTDFAQTIAASVLLQVLRMTRLSGSMRSFDSLIPACDWLEQVLEEPLDFDAIADGFEALLG